MSAPVSVPTPTHFLVVAYDAPAGDRMAHAAAHLEGVAPLHANGSGPLQFAGAIFSEDGSRMVGSAFCVKAESLESSTPCARL